jgi:hypothetical protein
MGEAARSERGQEDKGAKIKDHSLGLLYIPQLVEHRNVHENNGKMSRRIVNEDVDATASPTTKFRYYRTRAARQREENEARAAAEAAAAAEAEAEPAVQQAQLIHGQGVYSRQALSRAHGRLASWPISATELGSGVVGVKVAVNADVKHSRELLVSYEQDAPASIDFTVSVVQRASTVRARIFHLLDQSLQNRFFLSFVQSLQHLYQQLSTFITNAWAKCGWRTPTLHSAFFLLPCLLFLVWMLLCFIQHGKLNPTIQQQAQTTADYKPQRKKFQIEN